MFWMIVVYPRAAAVALASLLTFAALLLLGPDRPGVVVPTGMAIAAAGVVLSIVVARWEARRRGGTGEEGSGPIEPLGPGSAG